MSLSDELSRLEELRSRGTLSDVEFQQAKQQLLDSQNQSQGLGAELGSAMQSKPGMIMGVDEKTWCMLMHLSQLLTFSGLGIIAPILSWLIGKDQSQLVEQHGARMMNWLISSVIYLMIGGVLCIFVIGIPIVMVLAVLQIAFPIIAAMKCNNGELWSYPGSIKFFDEN